MENQETKDKTDQSKGLDLRSGSDHMSLQKHISRPKFKTSKFKTSYGQKTSLFQLKSDRL